MIIAVILLANFATALTPKHYAIFYFNTDAGFILTGVDVVSNDYYHEPDLFEDIDSFTEYTLVAEDADGDIIGMTDLRGSKTIMDYSYV
ncbi:MAG: hypothetical protein KJ574_02915, partial [Nanoarchaeota archaeon]|nr:hypothetical protein [Nanoarchaeota archaeon]